MIVAQTEAALEELIDAIADADRIGVDVEGNGLHAYRAELCVVQLAWQRGDDVSIGIVDPFAVDVDPLADMLSERGPVKVLHDLTFDARLLLESDVTLANVHDTSVMAQLLGEPKSGLASLVEIHFGVKLSKGLQDHDWAERPFTDKQLDYLSQDVRFLIELDDKLQEVVEERGIADEVATEIAYKLKTAREPPRDQRPPHERVKGYKGLSAQGRSVLKRLTEARERIAEQLDRPPFRIIPNGLLLEMARRLPSDERVVQKMCRRKAASRYADDWLEAIRMGQTDEPLPAPTERRSSESTSDEPMTAAEQGFRKRLKKKLNEWRKREAARRKVTLQVVIPGHCMSDVTNALAAHKGDPTATLEALVDVDGLGDARVDRYLGTWTAFASR